MLSLKSARLLKKIGMVPVVLSGGCWKKQKTLLTNSSFFRMLRLTPPLPPCTAFTTDALSYSRAFQIQAWKTCWFTSRQCCGSGMFYTGSRFLSILEPKTAKKRITELFSWVFTPNIATKLESRTRKNLFRIPDPGSKKPRIPYPQYCFKASITKVWHVTFWASRIRLVFC